MNRSSTAGSTTECDGYSDDSDDEYEDDDDDDAQASSKATTGSCSTNDADRL